MNAEGVAEGAEQSVKEGGHELAAAAEPSANHAGEADGHEEI